MSLNALYSREFHIMKKRIIFTQLLERSYPGLLKESGAKNSDNSSCNRSYIVDIYNYLNKYWQLFFFSHCVKCFEIANKKKIFHVSFRVRVG